MKAMILAAGLGTRLHPLTDNKPKALVEINGISMLERTIKYLISYGFDEIIINVHHFAKKIINFLEENNNFNIKIAISHENEVLLDTGGGLKKAAWFFDTNEPFLVHNVDIISNINLLNLYNYHVENKALVTLAVTERKTSRYLLFDKTKQLCGWENIESKEKIITKANSETKLLAFSGIQIINPGIFNLMKQEGAFSIINTYLELSKHQRIVGYEHNNEYWFDIGKPEILKKAENYLSTK
ncbi:MAG: nucleotidyltransferase family protein [Bacteroidales bacterium]|jgi:MurNAc alpha-1-phosphate uridylyltransferase|nr:nucleotidyltransferase family protein [Bacteroidales bacterium]